MSATAAAPTADPFYDFWLPDSCPACMAAGCDRHTTLTEPDAVTWSGGKRLLCLYRCGVCGHAWRQADLWTADCLGLVPVQKRRAA
jgi:hypothetical protein